MIIISLISLYVSYLVKIMQYTHSITYELTTKIFFIDNFIQILLFMLTLYGIVMGGQVKFRN